MSSTPGAPCARRWRRSSPTAGRARCSWRCSSIAAIASCRSAPTTWARTCPRLAMSRSRCGCARSMAPTRSCWCARSRQTHETQAVQPGAAEYSRVSRGTQGAGKRMRRKDVLDLDDFSVEELNEVLQTADAMKEVLSRPIKRVPPLRGKTIVNCFYEPSTRTRVSFELAAKNLSADVVNISASGSSVEKGESLVDTTRTLQALGADMVIMRHPHAGAPYLVARQLEASVINAGDGWHAHPSQALLDVYTVRERLGSI